MYSGENWRPLGDSGSFVTLKSQQLGENADFLTLLLFGDIVGFVDRVNRPQFPAKLPYYKNQYPSPQSRTKVHQPPDHGPTSPGLT